MRHEHSIPRAHARHTRQLAVQAIPQRAERMQQLGSIARISAVSGRRQRALCAAYYRTASSVGRIFWP